MQFRVAMHVHIFGSICLATKYSAVSKHSSACCHKVVGLICKQVISGVFFFVLEVVSL